MRVSIANNVRNFAGLDTRWAANAAISADALNKREQYYSITNVTCNRTWHYDAGKPVYILDAPNGITLVMQSFSLIVDKNQTIANLQNLGSRLKLSEGFFGSLEQEFCERILR